MHMRMHVRMRMRRLAELHAAGNGVGSLPAQLGPFTSLAHLSMQHNRLPLAALLPLAQLPALQRLDASGNPLTGGADGCSMQGQAPTFAQLTQLDVSSSRLAAAQPLQALLALMPRLAQLDVTNTPCTGGGEALLQVCASAEWAAGCASCTLTPFGWSAVDSAMCALSRAGPAAAWVGCRRLQRRRQRRRHTQPPGALQQQAPCAGQPTGRCGVRAGGCWALTHDGCRQQARPGQPAAPAAGGRV
jgi:hypothetical protein